MVQRHKLQNDLMEMLSIFLYRKDHINDLKTAADYNLLEEYAISALRNEPLFKAEVYSLVACVLSLVFNHYTAIEWEKAELLQKVRQLEADNTLLRKRLEPIENVWNSRLDGNGYDWGMGELDMQEAIKKCMELREGE